MVVSSLNSNKTNTEPTSSLPWDTDINQAMQKAKNTNKNIFVNFHADWCTYCHKMDDEVFSSTEIKEKLTKNYVLLKINVDQNPELSTQFQTYSLPTIIILDSNGNEIKRIIGYQSAEQLSNQI